MMNEFRLQSSHGIDILGNILRGSQACVEIEGALAVLEPSPSRGWLGIPFENNFLIKIDSQHLRKELQLWLCTTRSITP